MLRHDELQDSVAQKLQPLIIEIDADAFRGEDSDE